MKENVKITKKDITLDDFINICRRQYTVELSKEVYLLVKKSNKVIKKIVDNQECVYGVTTGFGYLSTVNIEKGDCVQLQKNLIMSHAVGVGERFDTEIVRGMMLLRIINLAKGYSGVRPIVIDTLIAMLNKGVHPCVPEKGSLGASGDLVPMSHVILPMIGLGLAEYKGEILSGKEAMEKAGISPIDLYEKEGLACINGTQAMTSVGAFVVYDALRLMKLANISAALSFEGLRGIVDVLDDRVHMLRPHAGQIAVARYISQLLTGSKYVTRQGELRVQDGYSLRCVPQVHGASNDAIQYAKEKIEIEMNSVTDNPLVFSDSGEVISAGNFHGQPIALAMDFLGIALAELANISERRIERLINSALNNGLPCFLVEDGGLNSGFMIVQYAAAALVSENKVLAHPASVDSIPSSCNQEDHVSMGTISARKAREILNNVADVLAMEVMCACQAIDLRGKRKLGIGTELAYKMVRKKILPLQCDRELYKDISEIKKVLMNDDFVQQVEMVLCDNDERKSAL